MQELDHPCRSVLALADALVGLLFVNSAIDQQLTDVSPLSGRKLAAMELRIVFTLIFWNFELQPTPPTLSTSEAEDGLAHRYVHLVRKAV